MDEIVYQCPECNFNADNLTELDNHMEDFHANLLNQINNNGAQNDNGMEDEYDQHNTNELDNENQYDSQEYDNNDDLYIENNDEDDIQNIDNDSNNQNGYDDENYNDVSYDKPHNLRQKQVLDYNHLNSTSSADVPNVSLLPQCLSSTLPTSISQMASVSPVNKSATQPKRQNGKVTKSQPPPTGNQPVINSDNHYERQYTCKRCGFFTNNPRAVLYHRRDFHFEKINIHECSYCQYASQYSGKVERHTLLRHKIDTNNTPKKHLVNRVKPDDSINNSLNLTAMHNGELDSSLSNRSINLTNRSMVSKTNNLDVIANQNNNPDSPMMISKYQCNKCPCKYKRSNDLSKHLKMKHGVVAQKLSDYLVNIPVESIWSKVDENNHLNSDYSINNVTVNQSMNNSNVMNESKLNNSQMNQSNIIEEKKPDLKSESQPELSKHKGEKSGCHECPYCTYYSNGNDAEYLLHVKDHLAGKSFRCVLCNSVYKYRGDCVVHLKRKHQKADMHAQNYVERFNLETVNINDVYPLLKPKAPEENENEEKLFGCAYCDYKANYKGDVFKHQTRRHPGFVKNVTALAQSKGPETIGSQSNNNNIVSNNRTTIKNMDFSTTQQNSSLNNNSNKPSITRVNMNQANNNNQNNRNSNKYHQNSIKESSFNQNISMNNSLNNTSNNYDLENGYHESDYENVSDFYYNNSQIKDSSEYTNGDYYMKSNDNTENDVYDDLEYNQPDDTTNYIYDDYEYNQVDNVENGYGDQDDFIDYNNTENEYIDYNEENFIDSDQNDFDKSNNYQRSVNPRPNGASSTILASVLNGAKDSNRRPGSSLSSLSTSSYSSNNVSGHNQRPILPAMNGQSKNDLSNTIVSSEYLANLKFLARRRSQHALRERKFKCPMCPRTSKWQWDIRKHMRTVHRGQEEGKDVIILKDKDLINKLSNPSQNNTHVDMNLVKSKCAILNNRSRLSGNEERINSNKDSGNKFTNFSGQQQQAGMATQGNNTQQAMSVGTDPTGNKKFKCTACPYRSNWKADLFRHLRKRHYIQRPALSDIIVLDADFAASSLGEYERVHGIHIRKRSRTEIDSNGMPMYLYNSGDLESGNEAKREKLSYDMSMNLVDDIDQQNQLQQEENNIELLNRNNRLPVSIAELNIKPYKCLKCGFRSDRKSDTLRHIRVKHSLSNQAVKFLRIMSIKEASDSIEEYENMRLYKKIKNFNTVSNDDAMTDATSNDIEKDNFNDNKSCCNDTEFYEKSEENKSLTKQEASTKCKSKDYYRCPFCSFKNVGKHAMRRHLVIHFSGTQSLRVTNPVYRCSICTFRSKWQFFVKKHITTHHLSVRNAYVLRYNAKPGKTESNKMHAVNEDSTECCEIDQESLETETAVDHEDNASSLEENIIDDNRSEDQVMMAGRFKLLTT